MAPGNAPNIVDRSDQAGPETSAQALARLRDVVTHGIPGGGMPAFTLPRRELDAIAAYIGALRAPAADHPPAGDSIAGEHFFFGGGQCATCHTVGGRGGVIGPDLSNIGRERKLAYIARALANPNSLKTAGYRAVSVRLHDGTALRGVARNESNYDLQLEDLDGRLHSSLKSDIAEETGDSISLMPPVRASASMCAISSPISVAWSTCRRPTISAHAGPTRPRRRLAARRLTRS